jgi:hypothetical protein
MMRNVIWALMVVAGAYALGSSPAEAKDYRYCLVEGFQPGPGTCYYDTYGQCMASASGRRAYCQLNPIFAFQQQQYGYGYNDQPRPVKKKKHRYHHHRHHQNH